VELTVLFQRELIPPHRLELWALIEALACGNVPFLDGVIHHRAEDRHLKADGGIADKGNRSFFGRLDLNRFQNSDAHGLLNLGAALGFVIREGLGHLFADLPNAVALVAPRAVHPTPRWIAAPKLIPDKVNLRGTDISV
jgi:hypothetical protein